MKTTIFALVLFAAVLAHGNEPARNQSNASATAVIIAPPRPETEWEKKRAEALDMCMRIYRWYGFVEVKIGPEGVVVCQ